jgi:hypothetical protein
MRYLNGVGDKVWMPREVSLPVGLKLSALQAVYCRADDAVAVGDLHLGYEASLQAEHVAIPRFQLRPMLDRLGEILLRFDPALVIINGDLKHEFGHNKRQEWTEVEALLDMLSGREVVAVRGNHDNYLQTILSKRGIRMTDSYTSSDGMLTFQHGHLRVLHGEGFRVFGHEHPMVRLRDAIGARMAVPCFLFDEPNGFLVMPAFSPLASGTDVSSPESAFMNPAIRNMDISKARVYAIHEGLMDFGTVGNLREMRDDFTLERMKDRNMRNGVERADV